MNMKHILIIGGLVFLAGIFGDICRGADPFAPVSILKRPEYQNAVSLFFQGDTEQAEQILTGFNTNEEEFPQPEILLAVLYASQGDFPAFYRACTKGIEADPNDPEGWFQLADRAIKEERYLEAQLLLEKGKEALNHFASAANRKSDSASRFYYLQNESLSLASRLAAGRGNYPQAEDFTRQLAARSPENDAVLLTLGWLLIEQGKTEEAVAVFDEARVKNSANFPGWLIASELLDRRGDTASAQKLADTRFQAAEAENADCLPQVIRLYLKWNRLADADRLIQKMTDTPERNLLAGRLFLYRGQYTDAEKAFLKAKLQNPDDFDILNGYALALAEINEGKRGQARQIAEQNLQQYPDSEEAVATLAWVEFLSGQTQKAENRLRPILDSGSFTPTTAYYMAEIALAQEDESLSRTLLELALGQEGQFPKRADAEKLKAALDKAEP